MSCQDIADGKYPGEFMIELVYAQGKAEPYLWEEQSYCYFIESRETEIASPEHLSSRDPQILRMSHVNSSFTRPFFPYRYFYFK